MEKSLIQGTVTISFSKLMEEKEEKALNKFIEIINSFNVDMKKLELKNNRKESINVEVNDIEINCESITSVEE